MPSDAVAAGPEHRLIHAILAAQVTALRERIASAEIYDRLVVCVELVAALSPQLAPGASAAATRLEAALEDLAFQHAQHQDLTRQTADLVARALHMLAAAQAFSLNDLRSLYVSEDQRRLHEAVLVEEESKRSLF